MPPSWIEIRRRVMQLQIEIEALRKEKDPASKQQLSKAEKELADLQEQNTQLTARWENEKGAMRRDQDIAGDNGPQASELEQAQRQGKWEVAARIQYGELAICSSKLDEAEKRLRELTASGNAMVKEEVSAEEIAEVVSRWTGVPVSRMLEGEREKLMQDGRAARQARHRSGRSGKRNIRCRAAQSRRAWGHESPDRFIPVPRANRRRKNRAVQSPGRVFVR